MKKSSPLLALAKRVVTLLAGAVGSWVLYSKFEIDHSVAIEPAIDAEREHFVGKSTRLLNVYVARTAGQESDSVSVPLVLIHSINAAASAYEMRPIFETYRGKRNVYALDLPGFGFSERADHDYSPAVYKQAIIDLLERVGQPADVVALSLSCEFAASAALERPELFRSLTMLSPTGFMRREDKHALQSATQTGKGDFFYNLFAFRLWGQAFYDLVATRKSIHYFLQRSFEGEVDAGMEAYAYRTAHQQGAHYAPLYFISGKLFTAHILETVYEKLTLPVLVLYDMENFVGFDLLPDLVDDLPNWRSVRIVPTRGLAQFEKMAEVAEQLDTFWRQLTVETTQ
jgi:pimeloyl-ACP methyl ester carboxylesterase